MSHRPAKLGAMLRLRNVVTLILLAGLVLIGFATVASAQDHPLLPDLDPLAPSRVRAAVASDGSGRQFLTFNFKYDNTGLGPLVLRGSRAGVSDPLVVDQVLLHDDGSESVVSGVGEMEYLAEVPYERWGFAHHSYELVSVADGSVAAVGPGIALCVTDSADIPEVSFPGEPARSVYTDCATGLPGSLGFDTGLSVGYRNEHGAYFAGQLMDVTSVSAGQYVLVHRVNASGVLAESNTANNASSALVNIRWSSGGGLRVSLLATCHDSATC